MITTLKRPTLPTLRLQAATAAELMTENPISVRQDADIHDAVEMMTRHGFTVAPVIDEAGRAVGVVSISDILIHDREYVSFLRASGDVYTEFLQHTGPIVAEPSKEIVDRATVREIMTPAIFMVSPDTSAAEVVRSLLAYHVHHLFVADEQGTLIGVIGMSDVLRRLG